MKTVSLASYQLNLKTYKNTKTGAVINSPFILKGGDWVLVETAKPKKEAPKRKTVKE